jgi:hypothetical protein
MEYSSHNEDIRSRQFVLKEISRIEGKPPAESKRVHVVAESFTHVLKIKSAADKVRMNRPRAKSGAGRVLQAMKSWRCAFGGRPGTNAMRAVARNYSGRAARSGVRPSRASFRGARKPRG